MLNTTCNDIVLNSSDDSSFIMSMCEGRRSYVLPFDRDGVY
jgi:hypothetical protein